MKLGILGTGMIVREFLPWLTGADSPFTVQCICSTQRSAEAAGELCEQYGIPQHTTNYFELLQDVDVVYLAVPNNQHARYVKVASRYDAFCAGETPVSFDPARAGGALMDLNVYNISYIVGLFGEPNQVHYTANIERGIDTSGILTMEYNSFRAVSIAAKDCGAPARYVIQGTKGYILQKSTANWCGGVTFHPNEGKEEHYNLNGGRPRQAAEFHAFARAIEGGDQELCSRMLDTSVAVSKVLTVARRSAGLKF